MPDTKTVAEDSAGHKYEIQELDPADALDLLEAGGEASSNTAWFRFAMIVCSVKSIDGVPVPLPRSKDEIKRLARRIGNPGLVAVSGAMFGSNAAPTMDEAAETAKN